MPTFSSTLLNIQCVFIIADPCLLVALSLSFQSAYVDGFCPDVESRFPVSLCDSHKIICVLVIWLVIWLFGWVLDFVNFTLLVIRS